MLMPSVRHTRRDLDHWNRLERYDAVIAQSDELKMATDRALKDIERFVSYGPCYCGVSWGKDSVVIAHLVRTVTPNVLLVWVKNEPIFNPDCPAVRDRFLNQHPGVYLETVVRLKTEPGYIPVPSRVPDFEEARAVVGSSRYISGIRGEESGERKQRMKTFGIMTKNTCAPIGQWTGAMIFAYLYANSLPVHPVYAMTMGGVKDRIRLRVSSFGGDGGKRYGREEWENLYYRDVLARIRREL